jgi:hypothetical protein
MNITLSTRALARIAAKSTVRSRIAIVIEVPDGGTRSGTSADGTTWSHELKGAGYGFLANTIGADGEEIDAYIGPDESASDVYVVSQLTAAGGFDEYKLMVGFKALGPAVACYCENMPPGLFGNVHTMPADLLESAMRSPKQVNASVEGHITRAAPRNPVRAPSVRLAAANDAAESPAARWIQVAYEGHFKGHWMGEFEFTANTFKQLVANFRASPAYRAGAPDAPAEYILAGHYDCVPFDFHHASEMPPNQGSIAVNGTPAQAWGLECEMRNGPDGKAQLWVYTRYLEPAATYVREGKYKWTSVSVLFDACDPVSGAKVGAILTSVAITNQPFLQGLPALAASRQPLGFRLLDRCDDAELLEGALGSMRWLFGLPPTAGAVDMQGEIIKLKSYLSPSGSVPSGIDIASIVCTLRSILGLRTLATVDEVFAELDSFFQRLNGAPESAPLNAPQLVQETTIMTTAAAPAPAPAPSTHSDGLRNELVSVYAPVLKIEASAMTDHKVLLAAQAGAGAMEELASMLEALGAKDVRAALAKIAEAKSISDRFSTLMPQLEAAKQESDMLKSQIDQMDQSAADAEINMAMDSLGCSRDGRESSPLRKTLLAARKADKEGFRSDYKITTGQAAAAPPAPTHLSQSIATVPTGTANGVDDIFGSNRRALARAEAVSRETPLGAEKVDLSSYEGVNELEKAINHARLQPGGDRLDYDALHSNAMRTLTAIRSRAA